MADVTELLQRWRQGEREALDALVPLVYDELRRLADAHLRSERTDHTLQATALVHEAYLRLTTVREAGFDNRAHFFGAAANAMRRILVDHARRRGAHKRGDGIRAIEIGEAGDIAIDSRVDILALDDALSRLASVSPVKERVVELRYFGGLSVDETAELLGIAPATVKRHWAFARAWLYRELGTG